MYVITNNKELETEFRIGDQIVKTTTKNHLDLVRQLLSHSDEVFFVSPFLYEDFTAFYKDLMLKGVSVELITTCAPRGDDQLRKPFSLRSFGYQTQISTGKWPVISIDQELHAKVYIFSKSANPFAGIVTSANLTGRGLTSNHESGILITDHKYLEELKEIHKQELSFVCLSEYQIKMLCIAAEEGGKKHRSKPDKDIGLGNILEKFCTPSAGNRNIKLRDSAEYYIKVSGTRDDPILPEDRMAIDEPHTQLSFAKSPGSIKLGDCLLEIAVGGKCFLSYYSCASPVYERTDEEKRTNSECRRWPFYVYANNLSLHYGKDWFQRPLYYDGVVEKFHREYPKSEVTHAGKDHFVGAIQMGNSYVHVTKQFGEFVRREIDALEI